MKYTVTPAQNLQYGSRSSRRAQQHDLLAKSIIWFAAGLTLLVLVLIVGFIVINGFISRPMDSSESLSYKSDVVWMQESGKEFVIAVNNSLRLEDLTYTDLRDIYSGSNKFWGFLSGQNIAVQPLLFSKTDFNNDVYEYLLLREGEQGAVTGAKVMEKADINSLWKSLKAEKGGIALFPAEYIEEIPRGVKIIALRELSLVTHPDTTELHDGQRLSYIVTNEDTDKKLMTGKISDWDEIGGPKRAVKPVVFNKKNERQYEIIKNALPELDPAVDSISVNSVEEFVVVMNNVSGAVGVIRTREAVINNLNIIESRRRQIKLNLRPAFLLESPSRAGAVGGIRTIIINTLVMIVFVLLIATPIGLGAAIYLVEYARQGRLVSIFRLGTETLAGVPSIIFGLFGLVFFSQFLGMKTGLLSGTLTLTLMILPTLVRTSEEALKAVPEELREGSLALGASKLQTIFGVVIPTASPGIITGVILGIGRAIGETAAILFTMGSNMSLIKNLNSPIRVLSVHLYLLIRENISMENAFATATILVIIVFLVNFVTRKLIGRMSKVS